jgi:hypothetical protein
MDALLALLSQSPTLQQTAPRFFTECMARLFAQLLAIRDEAMATTERIATDAEVLNAQNIEQQRIRVLFSL